MKKEIEEWKQILGYKGYEVSNLGNVRSTDRVTFDGRTLKGRILKTSANRFGYLKFNVSTKQGQKQLRVHRCVLETFNPSTKHCTQWT